MLCSILFKRNSKTFMHTIKNKLLKIYQMKYRNTVYGDILGLDSLKFILHKLKSNRHYKGLSDLIQVS